MPPRIWVLPAAAIAIAGLCVYKSTREYDDAPVALPDALLPAQQFGFELKDQNNRQVKLERYLGRHRILVVFFDGEAGAENDPVIVRLRREFDAIEKTGTKIIGVSTAIPQLNRPRQRTGTAKPPPNQVTEAFPIELLTDVAPVCEVHRIWGRYDEENQRPTTGTFLIDRAGRVAVDGEIPKPLENPQATIDRLLNE